MSKSALRTKEIISLINKLDITPSMFKNAVSKYQNISNFLQENDIYSDIYPQGSFALGTVVRPIASENSSNYDLDIVCQLQLEKNETTPLKIKEKIETVFENSDLYKSKLTKYDKCCTITYSEISNATFSIDIIPAVPENIEKINSIKSKYLDNCYYDKSIAITNIEGSIYNWATNNPKGYKEWFMTINKPFLENSQKTSRRQLLFESYKSEFSTIEDIPEDMERSTLQRVIQILKLHRDVYFSNKKNGDSTKPISAIITTLVASIAQGIDPDIELDTLLKYIIAELSIYSKQQSLSEVTFSSQYSNKKIIQKKSGEWLLLNPANPEDNLVDSWNTNSDKIEAFFKWISVLESDFANIFDEVDDSKFISSLNESFGFDFVNANVDQTKYREFIKTPNSFSPKSQSKPWSN